MLKEGHSPDEGIEAFEGFCVDLLREIAAQTNMSYKIHLVRDGKYGASMANGSWNGMVGELIDGVNVISLHGQKIATTLVCFLSIKLYPHPMATSTDQVHCPNLTYM